MEKQWLYVILTGVLAIVLFFVTNYRFQGYLRSEVNLGKELKTPADSLHEYRLAKEAPFKYRLVFPAIIKGSYRLMANEHDAIAFYRTYKFWSAFFYAASAIALFFLLRTLAFSAGYSFAGALIFLLLPPMLMAFTLPVHTREDTLAYTLFFVALNFLSRGWRLPFLAVAIAGALTRETLLLLPLLYFFFADDKNMLRRLFIAGVPGIVWLSVRVFSGHEPYDPWEGLKWNLANPEQVAGFLFLTFNVCWIPLLMHLLYYRTSIDTSPSGLRFFYRSAFFTLVVILVTTFIGGIYNEIRLLYLFFPWIVVIFLDFIRNNETVFTGLMQKRSYWMYATGALLVCLAVLYIVIRYREKLITPGKWAVPYDLWIIVTVAYVFVLFLFLPAFLRVWSLKRSVK